MAFTLTEAERQSPLWAKLLAHFEERLRQARVANDNQDLDPVNTAALRARIETYKGLIRLNEVRPPD